MGRVERHVGKFLEPASPPPPLGTPGSFPGIGLDMLGSRALVLPALESRRLPFAVPSAPDRAAPGRTGVWGHRGRAAACLSFGTTPARRASSPPFPPPL